jgi:hypothetical protein
MHADAIIFHVSMTVSEHVTLPSLLLGTGYATGLQCRLLAAVPLPAWPIVASTALTSGMYWHSNRLQLWADGEVPSSHPSAAGDVLESHSGRQLREGGAREGRGHSECSGRGMKEER